MILQNSFSKAAFPKYVPFVSTCVDKFVLDTIIGAIPLSSVFNKQLFTISVLCQDLIILILVKS